MNKSCLSIFFGTVLLGVSMAAPGHAALPAIIEDGKPNAEIVISETPSRVSKFAAKELQSYLEKITGAKLPIVTSPDDSKVQIFVGASAFTEKLGVSTEGLRHGAFQISSGPNWLALVGPDKDYVPIEPWGRMRSPQERDRVNKEWDKITGDTFWNNFDELYWRYDEELDLWDFDDMGTLNAVHEYLRKLGVRWFAPGEIGEVVPEKKTVLLPDWNETFTPDFPLRNLRYFYPREHFGEIRLWNLRMGINMGHDLIGITQPGHGIKFVIMREEMKQAHPEIYATMNGEPNTTHKLSGVPALTSPLLLDKQVKYSRAVFDHFEEPMLSIDLVDGYGGIDSDEKRKFSDPSRGWPGSMSEFVWEYLNRVALELHKSHPERLVSGLSYSAYQESPKNIETMSPNLAIVECRWRSGFHNEETRARHKAMREEWLKKLPSGKYFIWDYYLHSRPDEVGRPVVFPGLIANDLRELKGKSLGDTIEVYNHFHEWKDRYKYDAFALNHINLYVTSRLWWDADQDLGALMQDYYTNYYGPAAEPMKAFLEYSEANWPFMGQDAERITKALDLLETARASVDPESVYGQRITKIVEYVQPLIPLREQLGRKRESKDSYRVLDAQQQKATRMSEKPLNGRLDTEHWPNVRVSQLLPNIPGRAPGPGGRFQVLRENDILRFGIFCQEPDMANLNISTEESGDPKIFDGDYVTLLIETPMRSYYQIAVNPAGAVYEIDRGPNAPPLWKSGAKAAVHKGDDFWSVEIRLPIAGEGARVLDPTTGIDGAAPTGLLPWYFNVGRQRVREGIVQLSAYSPTGKEDFLVPEKFAHMFAK